MTEAVEETASSANGRGAVRNVAILAYMHALLGAQMPVFIILGGLAGSMLSTDPSLATLPIACQMIAAMIAAAPVSLMMGRWGRKPGFLLGAASGMTGGGLGAYAILAGDFWLLCAAHGFAGLYQTTQNYFRFAATDAAEDRFKPRAISYVLAGGLVGALIGPELVVRFGDLFAPIPFAGAYAATIATSLIGAAAIPFLDLPRPRRLARHETGRPVSEILRENKAVPTAILCGMISYGTMTFVMTSTPLAIVACGYGSGDAANVVRFHVLAMFGPSFFTGSLIARFGHVKIIGAGLAMLAACSAVALTGIELHQFYIALVLLGLGWNFGFIGATSLLAVSHAPEERAKIQGLNDFLVMSMVAAAALGSGKIMDFGGWEVVNISVFAPLALAAATLVWLSLKPRPAA